MHFSSYIAAFLLVLPLTVLAGGPSNYANPRERHGVSPGTGVNFRHPNGRDAIAMVLEREHNGRVHLEANHRELFTIHSEHGLIPTNSRYMSEDEARQRHRDSIDLPRTELVPHGLSRLGSEIGLPPAYGSLHANPPPPPAQHANPSPPPAYGHPPPPAYGSHPANPPLVHGSQRGSPPPAYEPQRADPHGSQHRHPPPVLGNPPPVHGPPPPVHGPPPPASESDRERWYNYDGHIVKKFQGPH